MTLVLVLSIIVLFLLMGTSFVILSNNYLNSARVRLKNLDVKGDQPRDLVNRAFTICYAVHLCKTPIHRCVASRSWLTSMAMEYLERSLQLPMLRSWSLMVRAIKLA